MPSGRTHDRITIWGLPMVVGMTFWQTRNGNLTLLVASGFMLGGLMFGPDLDIYSVQYQRWGWLRWIWLPYQKSLRHRSFLSHGPVIGTTLRVLYFVLILLLPTLILLVVVEKLGNMALDWQQLAGEIMRSLLVYNQEFLVLFLGLELGAMSHYVSDSVGSAYKRYKKQGIQGLLKTTKKRKPAIRKGRQQVAGSRGKRSRGQRENFNPTNRAKSKK
jgi:uncharacterized metal-binding protein